MGTVFDYIIMLGPLLVGFYTVTFSRWLWQKKNKAGALGVGLLAVGEVIYPAYVLFFVHQ